MFKNGGVFAPMAPTIHCKTCKDRRHGRTSVDDQDQEKGFVFLTIFLSIERLQTNIVSNNLLPEC